MTRLRVCVGCLLGFVLVVLSSHCGNLAQQPDADIPLAAPAPLFNELFRRTNGGWTGGDGTLSIRLPDGRNAWLFGDTLLGHVAADGTRSEDTPFIRNSLVVQDHGRLETRYRNTNGKPSAYFPSPAAASWYWPGDGTVVGNRVEVFLHRFRQDTPQMWAWEWTGTVLATLTLPTLAVERIDAVVSENHVLYGVSVLETEGYTYIYGTQDAGHPKFAHLARAPTGSMKGPWTFYTGKGWSHDPAATSPILSGVSTQYAVFNMDRRFYLVTMDSRSPFPETIAVYRAATPWGPWQGPLIIYQVPGVDHDIVAYNPFVHAQFTDGDRRLVSYNMNHVNDPAALYADAAIYRPRFIWVAFSEVDRRLGSK